MDIDNHTDELLDVSNNPENEVEISEDSLRKFEEEEMKQAFNMNNKLIVKLQNSSFLDDINLEKIARATIQTIETVESCTHEVAVPPNQEYVPLICTQNKPAKEYKFILDPFQKEAILCIEQNQSILVSAHTSAGKTVVAEYAIACSLRDKKRVIYTTPIKALSNQKYKEFHKEFKDVGLVTGEVTINLTASILIMTTEILRNMLYKDSEVIREVSWVIFDEIHYISDKQRGVVWEETLMLLPDNVHYVFLSATIPNALEFAEWVVYLHKQPCHVISTDRRPTPLQHYIFPINSDGIYMVKNQMGQFKENNFNQAMACLQNVTAKNHKDGLHNVDTMKTNISGIVKMIMKRNFAPAIIFSFSKKDCEIYAMLIAELDFNTLEEKKLVDKVINNTVSMLNDKDKKLPQVLNLLPLLRHGIGIHHGGLLPILKELVEMLFSKGLIKILFATETLAMGLNMPARTVVFTTPRKFDGNDFRWITSGEYIQMSGRAGRRGIDDKGIVILMIDEQISSAVVKALLYGKPDPICSAFHLTDSTILNLLQVEKINAEYMLKKSFLQFQKQTDVVILYNKLKELQTAYNAITIENYDEIFNYNHIYQRLDELNTKFRSFFTPENLMRFLNPGRLIKVKTEKGISDWGMVVFWRKRLRKYPVEKPILIIDVLFQKTQKTSEDSEEDKKPRALGHFEENFERISVSHESICQISTIKIFFPGSYQFYNDTVIEIIQETKQIFSEGLPLIDPIVDIGIKDQAFKIIIKNIEIIDDLLHKHPLHKDSNIDILHKQFLQKEELATQFKQVLKEFNQAKSIFQDELKSRKHVLRSMGYCTTSDIIELKGRVACELNGVDALLMTEMIFNGVFNTLNVPQIVALISCFVCDEKSYEMPESTEELSIPFKQMLDLARKVAKVSIEINLDEDAYVNSFKPYLMYAMYAWCKGATFSQICKMTNIFEGSIIRCMRRLEEILRHLCQAARDIGSTDLENKFSEAIRLIKRDIVFTASLYL